MKKLVCCGIVILLFASQYLSQCAEGSTTLIVSLPHLSTSLSIHINGNAEFNASNGVVSGNGSQNNPYIIEGWNMTMQDNHYAVSIENTTAYFIIKDFQISNLSHTLDYYRPNYNSGIMLSNVQNGIIENNTMVGVPHWHGDVIGTPVIGINIYNSSNISISNNILKYYLDDGILLRKSILIKISNNTLTANFGGISLESSSNNSILYNMIYNNFFSGIFLGVSWANRISYNLCINSGIIMDGNVLTDFVQYIDLTNTINGKPIYYFLDKNGIEIDNWTIGQLIFVNCSNSTVRNVAIYNIHTGIAIMYSINITIKNSNIYNNSAYGINIFNSRNINMLHNEIYSNRVAGVQLSYSDTNSISYNSIYWNFEGIELFSSDKNIIAYNKIYSNNITIPLSTSGCGLDISDSDFNIISGNNITNNNMGVYLEGEYNTISFNDVCYNGYYGIWIYGAYLNMLSHNNINSNVHEGIYFCQSSSNTVSFNNITNNNKCGINITSYGDNYSSKYNKIFQNNFTNNNAGKIQAFDETGMNFWNTSTDGNYWSEWTTPDNDSNGIVDIPYTLDGKAGAKDYLPLIHHTENIPPGSPPTSLITVTIIGIVLLGIVIGSVAFTLIKKRDKNT